MLIKNNCQSYVMPLGTIFIHQNLTSVDIRYKDGPRTERIKIFIMAVDQSHRYSNKAERANHDIYDNFKLKKIFGLQGLYKNISAL